jgi:hypothetical protein
MHALVLAGRRARAVELYDRANTRGLKLGLVPTNVALGAAARCGQFVLRRGPTHDVPRLAWLPLLARSRFNSVPTEALLFAASMCSLRACAHCCTELTAALLTSLQALCSPPCGFVLLVSG